MISHRSQYYQSLLPLCNTAKVIIEVKNINNHHQFSQKDWRIMCLCFVWYSFYVSELSNIHCLCDSFGLHKAKVRRFVFSSLSPDKNSQNFIKSKLTKSSLLVLKIFLFLILVVDYKMCAFISSSEKMNKY